jgi:two-component system chemotaxis response regulator CheY
MNVIIQNSEQFLADTLARSNVEKTLLLVGVIKFSNLIEKSQTWFDDVCAAASTFFADMQGTVLRHGNDDVVILSSQVMRKRFDQFLECLAPVLGDLHGLSSLYELPIDSAALNKYCASTRLAERLPVQPPGNEGVMLPTASDLAVKTLQQRRDKRPTPVVQFVEDDLFSRKLLVNSLPEDYGVSQSGTGHDAVETYLTSAPDVLFLDIGLPDIDGHKVLERILTLDPKAYIIMLSGKGDRETIVKSIETGAKGFIGKPFTRQKLLSYIQNSPFIKTKEARKPFVHAY